MLWCIGPSFSWDGLSYEKSFCFIQLLFFLLEIIALQCCVSSCCTTVNQYMNTYIPSFLSLPPGPSHPSRSSQRTELEFPVLYSSFHILYYASYLFYTWPHIYVSAAPPSSSHPPLSWFICTYFSRFHIYGLIYNTCFMKSVSNLQSILESVLPIVLCKLMVTLG